MSTKTPPSPVEARTPWPPPTAPAGRAWARWTSHEATLPSADATALRDRAADLGVPATALLSARIATVATAWSAGPALLGVRPGPDDPPGAVPRTVTVAAGADDRTARAIADPTSAAPDAGAPISGVGSPVLLDPAWRPVLHAPADGALVVLGARDDGDDLVVGAAVVADRVATTATELVADALATAAGRPLPSVATTTGRPDRTSAVRVLLTDHPAVDDAVVRVLPDPGPDVVVGAARDAPTDAVLSTDRDALDAVVAAPRATAADLRAYLRRRLPEDDVPTLRVVPVVPRRPDGTVDDDALTTARTTTTADVPDLARVDALAELLADELDLPSVAPTDNFFDLGGNSLIAARLAHRLRRELDLAVDLGTLLPLLRGSDVCEIAGALHTGDGTRDDTDLDLPAVRHAPDDRYAPFPLTDQQQAYLLGRGDAFASGGVACHTYYEFDGPRVDDERLARSWAGVLERHDALRTTFDPETLTQRIVPSPVVHPPEVIDLRGRSAEERDAELAAVRERLSHRVAPLDGDPLVDLVLVHHDDGSRVCFGVDGLLADIAATSVVFDELSAGYADPDGTIEPPGVSFRDYVLAEARIEDHPVGRRDRAWWDARLPDLPPAPELPLAVDPRTVTDPAFVPHPVVLDADTWSGVRERAAARRLTPSGVLLAAFAETVATWARSPRFTLNLPRFNRLGLHDDVDAVVGEFASFTLLPVDASEPEPLADRARRLQEDLWEALAHEHVSGMHVLRELMRRRGGLGQALMPIVFTSGVALPGDPTTLLDGALERTYRIAQTPQVWLDLIVEEQDGVLIANWDAVDALFPDGLMDDMSAAFGARLRALAGSDDAWTSATTDPVPARQRAVRAAVAGPRTTIPEEPAHAAILRQAAARPDRIAVRAGDGGHDLSYGALVARAEHLARRLVAAGAEPGRPVAVLAEKGPGQVVSVLAAHLAAAPYLPIDPEQPAPRIARVLELGEVRHVLASPATRELAAAHDADVLVVEGSDPGPDAVAPDHVGPASSTDAAPPAPVPGHAPASAPAPVLPPAPGPRDVAYVLFTSGSTGDPKGVTIEHRSVVNCVAATLDELDLGPDDAALGVTALHHDLSVFDVFGVLAVGATLVLPDGDRRRDPAHWGALIARHGVRTWNSVPAMLELLLDEPGVPADAPETLRTVILGGDWVPPQLVARLRDRAPGAAVRSIGGPTETTVWNVWHPVGDLADGQRTIPYGRPIANTVYRVVDEHGDDRPDHAVGELWCSGASLARGYWRDDERTAAAFVEQDGERWYRTGDLGSFRPDGELLFHGRADFQVQVRGQRIELGAVEAAIEAHPGVAQAVVVGVPHRGDRPGHRALAAYVVPSTTTGVPADALRRHLLERVAPHELPASFTTLEALPLSRNGKVDRRALPAPPDLDDAGGADPPRGPLEQVLAGAWATALGVESVGRDDDFFALGGDSLVATRLVGTLRRTLPGLRLGVRDVFVALTVAESAERLRGAETTPGRLERVAALVLEVDGMDDATVDRGLRERTA